MNSMELVWFTVGFAALPVGVLVAGLLVLRREPDMRAWVQYMWLVGLAVIAWLVLMTVQLRLDPPSGVKSTNLEIVYALSLVLSLPAIVIIGSFWFFVGRAAAAERETRASPLMRN